jgi:hypothetical protein
MDELFELIRAFNRLDDKVNAINAKIDLLLKSPFKNLVFDTNAACKLLNVCPRTLFEMRKKGLIPSLKTNGKVQYAASDILAYLRRSAKLEKISQKPLTLKNPES